MFDLFDYIPSVSRVSRNRVSKAFFTVSLRRKPAPQKRIPNAPSGIFFHRFWDFLRISDVYAHLVDNFVDNLLIAYNCTFGNITIKRFMFFIYANNTNFHILLSIILSTCYPPMYNNPLALPGWELIGEDN